MKHKISVTLEVLVVSLLLFSAVLCAYIAIIAPLYAVVVASVIVVFAVLTLLFARHIRHLSRRWLTGTSFQGSRLQYSLAYLPTPAAALSDKTILWYNDAFQQGMLGGEEFNLLPVNKALPGLELEKTSTAEGQCLRVGGKLWHVFSSSIAKRDEAVTILYFTEETTLRAIATEYTQSRPGCLLIMIDGYADIFGDLLDSERARIMEGVNRILEDAIGKSASGILRRFASGQYIAVVEERHLARFAQEKYAIIDKIRALDDTLNLSVSIGVGRGGASYRECQEMAVQALDMAQGRGGDQVAEKTLDGFVFYGGVSHGVEKRSKVKSRLMATALVELIKQSDSVLIMGHRMTDLDAIGAAQGVLRICKICGVPAVIAVRREATLAENLINAFTQAGCGEDFIAPEQALDVVTNKTLCVVVDTFQEALVESREILQSCDNVVVIDHHRKAVGHIENIALLCHEPYASSASELVCELLQYVGAKGDKPTRLEAEAMLAGIMLDTRNFSLHTGVRTFEAAASLRRYGAETEKAKALFNTGLDVYRAKCKLVESARIYKGCAISMGEALAQGTGVATPQAANDLLTIEGVQASFVAVENGAGVSISARSMGEVNVQVVMEAIGGGGHQTMAGGQLRDVTLAQAYQKICAAIDLYRAAQVQAPRK